MDGWMDGWIVQTNRKAGRQAGRQRNKQTNKRRDIQTNKQTNREMDSIVWYGIVSLIEYVSILFWSMLFLSILSIYYLSIGLSLSLSLCSVWLQRSRPTGTRCGLSVYLSLYSLSKAKQKDHKIKGPPIVC